MSDGNLGQQVEALALKLDDLESREAIRTCIYRVNRGIDRIDRAMLESAFHADALVRWGTPEPIPVADWIEAALVMQTKTSRTSHLVGNILIELDGDEARVEAYEIGRHLTAMPDGEKDLIIAARYVDKFARRDGEWRIVHREKIGDWVRIMAGSDPVYDGMPLKGSRDLSDRSYELFGEGVFGGGR